MRDARGPRKAREACSLLHKGCTMRSALTQHPMLLTTSFGKGMPSRRMTLGPPLKKA